MAAKRVVGIIPAKGYSRRVARKNMRLFNGKPLIYYTLHCALESQLLDEIYVSTDSDEIKAYCESEGVKVPFMRPPEFSRDEVHGSVPILDMLEKLGGSSTYSHCVSLLPTCPLRRARSVDAIIALSMKYHRNVLSVSPLGKVIYHLRTLSAEGVLTPIAKDCVFNFQTQDAPELLYLSAVAQCAPAEELLKHRTFQYGSPMGYAVNSIEAWDIDTEEDFQVAERLSDLVPYGHDHAK